MIVDEPLAAIGHPPGERDQRHPGGEFLLGAWKASIDKVCLMVL